MKPINQLMALGITLWVIVVGNIAIADSKAEAISICTAAEKARKAAAQAKMEWSTTKPLIKSGKTAIKKGQFSQSIEVCSKARFQGETSVKQAILESESWRSRVPQ